jgi:hypothetical protein
MQPAALHLGFDGFTSTFQQKLFRQYTTSILNQIFFTTVETLYKLRIQL